MTEVHRKDGTCCGNFSPVSAGGVVVPIGSVHPRNEPSNEVDLEGRLMEVDESGSGILGNPWEWKKQHEWNMIGF